MNKYKVIYYMSVLALIPVIEWIEKKSKNLANPYQSDQFIWAYFALIPVVDWIEKKSKNLASEKGE